MSDYINFIDSSAIKLADLAFEISHLRCASENYSKALKRLRYYQIDRIQLALMSFDFEQKIINYNGKIHFWSIHFNNLKVGV